MKLIKCYVTSFGTLKNFEYDFTDGLNSIHQENGFGKTTLATFIKAMFYGLSGKGKSKITDNERKKYRPWNSTGLFGGYVIFEYANRRFKIERFFGSKESEDTAILTDLDTGKIQKETFDLGRRVFDIDEDGFLSTTYLSQKDFEITSNASLTAKFNAVSDNAEENNFEQVVSRLNTNANKYQGKGGRGYIADEKQAIADCERNLRDIEQSETILENLKEKEKNLTIEVDGFSKQVSVLTSKIESSARAETVATKKQHFNSLIFRAEQLKTKLDNVQAVLNRAEVNNEQISNVSNSITELERLNVEKIALKSTLEALSVSTQNNKKSKTPYALILFILSIALLTVGCVFIAFELIVSFIAFGIGVFLLVAGIILKVKPKKQPKQDDTLSIQQQKIAQIENRINELNGVINEFFVKFSVPVDNYYLALEKIKRALQEKAQISAEVDLLHAEIIKLKEDPDLKVEDVNFISTTDLRQELNKINAIYRQKADELASLRTQIERYENMVGRYTELIEERDLRKEKLSALEERYRIFNLTINYLTLADDNLKRKYRMPLQESFDRYLSTLTDGKRKGNIDVDLNVALEENGLSTSPEFYSEGYKNIFELCKRFSLIDVLFTKEKPFIILDDPFNNLDDKNLKSALAVIEKLSKEYQILYLVCHTSRTV